MAEDAILTKIMKARVQIALKAPFFSALLLRLRMHEAKKHELWCPTMATNGKWLKYNKNFVEEMSNEELKGVLVHEAMHCGLQHPTRCGTRDPLIWNLAADFTVNPFLIDAGYSLIKGALVNDKFRGMSTEKVYSILLEEAEKGGVGETSGINWVHVKCLGEGEGDFGGMGGVVPYRGDDAEELDEEWKGALQQAHKVAKNQGNVPAGIDRLIRELFAPKINWKEALRQFVAERMKDNFLWERPNRRFISSGIYLPSLDGEKIQIDIISDTSGSMSEQQLCEVASEVKDIVKVCNGEILMVYVDCSVAGVQHINPWSDEPIEMKGGGGTCFRPGFEYLDNEGRTPNGVVYFTDGYCNTYPASPDYPVLWIISGENHDFDPPFGSVTFMD